jgi:hypothetical protein
MLPHGLHHHRNHLVETAQRARPTMRKTYAQAAEP